MIPYTTCMRFNRNARVRNVAGEESGHREVPVPTQTRARQHTVERFNREWTLLVPRSENNQEVRQRLLFLYFILVIID